MKQPDKILRSGTIVITNAELDLTTGLLVKKKHIDARVANRRGVIKGIVPGHGGDVYWVWHRGSDGVAAYGWREFELAEPRRVHRERAVDRPTLQDEYVVRLDSWDHMEASLLAQVIEGAGSIRKAAKVLDVPRSTLGAWVRRHRERGTWPSV
jgi:hypothetical protein